MRNSHNFRNFFLVLYKYKISIILIWLTTVLTIVMGNNLVTPIYQSESTILVKFGREYVYSPEVGDDKPFNYYNRSSLINSEIEILYSNDLIYSVIEEIGFDHFNKRGFVDNLVGETGIKLSSPGDIVKAATNSLDLKRYYIKNDEKVDGFWARTLEKLDRYGMDVLSDTEVSRIDIEEDRRYAVSYFYQNYKVLGSGDTDIIKLVFNHHDPVICADVINLLVKKYQEKHIEILRDQRITDFLEDTVTRYERDLMAVEDRLNLYREEQAEKSVDLQEKVLIDQLSSFDTKLKQQQSELAGLDNRIKSLEKQKMSMNESTQLYSETRERDPAIDETKRNLLRLRLLEQELLGTYSEKSTQVENIRSRIEIVESYLKENQDQKQSTVRVGKSLAYQELERDVLVTTARREELLGTIEALKSRVSEINVDLRKYLSGNQELQELLRQKEIHEGNYIAYKQKLEEAKINEVMDDLLLTNIKTVEAAGVPSHPILPRKTLNLIIGFIIGGVAGIGLAFIRKAINPSIDIPEELEERLELPVLLSISDRKEI